MGYGGQGAGGDIPGGATLNFDVEVVGHSNDAPPEPNLFADLDTNEDGKLTKEEVLEFFKKQGKDELPAGLWDSEDKDGDGERRPAVLTVGCWWRSEVLSHHPRLTARLPPCVRHRLHRVGGVWRP